MAGAVTEAVRDRRQALLVNHRSTTKLIPHHNRLLDGLRAAAGDRAPYHIPVWVNKEKALGFEFTQRTRSFLFPSLGALFARLIGLGRVRFYENEDRPRALPPDAGRGFREGGAWRCEKQCS